MGAIKNYRGRVAVLRVPEEADRPLPENTSRRDARTVASSSLSRPLPFALRSTSSSSAGRHPDHSAPSVAVSGGPHLAAACCLRLRRTRRGSAMRPRAPSQTRAQAGGLARGRERDSAQGGRPGRRLPAGGTVCAGPGAGRAGERGPHRVGGRAGGTLARRGAHCPAGRRPPHGCPQYICVPGNCLDRTNNYRLPTPAADNFFPCCPWRSPRWEGVDHLRAGGGTSRTLASTLCVCVHACFQIVLHVFGVPGILFTHLEHMLA